jgi:hypothetical protein
VGVFTQYENPTSRTTYFFFQAPELLFHQRFLNRLTVGLFINDIGPVTTVLIAIGAAGALLRREWVRPLWSWTLMGVIFILLMAPKFLDHDYYGLPLVPAASGWGAIGWRLWASALRRRHGMRTWRVVLVMSLLAVIQSPRVMCSKYALEEDHAVVASRIRQFCPESGKVIVLGQQLGWAAVHYSGRQGWVERCRKLPSDWEGTFRTYHRLGAELVALYFDPSVPEKVRQSYLPILQTLPVLEHRSGLWFRGAQPCEYYILGLDGLGGPAGNVVAGARPDRRIR